MSTFISPSIDANVQLSVIYAGHRAKRRYNIIGKRINFEDPPIPYDPIPQGIRKQIERYGSIEFDTTAFESEGISLTQADGGTTF